MDKPTFIIDIPADEYHKATKDGRYVTSHRLATFRRCPAEYKKVIDGVIVQGDTQSFIVGRATHTLVLEGAEKFAKEYLVSNGPINPKTNEPYGAMTKAYKEWAEAQKSQVIRTDEHDVMAKMAEAVRKHTVAAGLLADGFAEGTVRTMWDGVPVQARMDWFNPATGDLVDLKTCNDIDRFRFDIRDFGYCYQLAFYRKVLELAGYDAPVKCWIVAVEKKEPFRVAVINISDSTISDMNEAHMGSETWRDDNKAMIAELKTYRRTDTWPTRYEHVITI